MTAVTAGSLPAVERTPGRRAALGIAGGLLAVHVLFCVPICSNSSASGPLAADQFILRLDPNQATAAELRLLPRIGEKLAANIITYRESVATRPAFAQPEDLARVPRIGPATVELLRPHLSLPGSGPPPPQEEHQ